MKADFSYEDDLWNRGFECVIGVDEVGKGAFAGPVVAAAVVFPPKIHQTISQFDRTLLFQINDSKQLTPQKREKLAKFIQKYALGTALASCELPVINKQGIGQATTKAIRKATAGIIVKIKDMQTKSYLLVDGYYVRYVKGFGAGRQKAIIKGDEKSISIAAASIIAKVYRDSLMKQLDAHFPKYHLAYNKGYGTKQHRDAIHQYGLREIHRTSFNLTKFTQ